MLYKIESIKHSRGTLKGLDRQDDRYPMRIVRIISLDINDILKIKSIYDISKKLKETRDIKVKTLKL